MIYEHDKSTRPYCTSTLPIGQDEDSPTRTSHSPAKNKTENNNINPLIITENILNIYIVYCIE